jgi:hypothetical protein
MRSVSSDVSAAPGSDSARCSSSACPLAWPLAWPFGAQRPRADGALPGVVYEFCAGRVVHARRKFDELIKHGHSEVTAEAVRRLAWVFKVEKQAREANSQGRLGLGKCLAQQHWDDLHAWMQRERQRVLDGSGIARTLDYSLNRWGALSRFLIDGEVSCHNNWSCPHISGHGLFAM